MIATDPIYSFSHAFAFLSNFYPSTIVAEFAGLKYNVDTVEHAFQAAKAIGLDQFYQIAHAASPGQAKMLGRRCELREDWERIKEEVMLDLLRQKFAPGTPLAKRLLATGDRYLEEGNHWGDTYWGTCKGVGQNRLGVLLMQVRKELR